MAELKLPTKVTSFEDISRAFRELEKNVNALHKSKTSAEDEHKETEGESGDVRATRNVDGTYTFEVRTKEGWKTPAIGDSVIKFKDKPSTISKNIVKAIDEIAADDVITGDTKAKKVIFDEKNDKFVMPRPDYDSGWVANGGDRTHGTHTLGVTLSLIQVYWSNDEGTNIHTVTYTISGHANELWLTSTTWSLQANTTYGYYRETTSGTTFTAIADQGHFKVLLWK